MTDGLITHPSPLDVGAAAAKLEAAIQAKGLTLFARIDHGAGAADAGLVLRPTILLIFGNAKCGTPLMQAAPTMGIDLPLKFLVWQDAGGQTQISYNSPAWLAARHGANLTPVTEAMTHLLDSLAQAF